MSQPAEHASLRSLLSDSLVFGLGGPLAGLVGLVTFPVMARYLGPDDFGLLSLYRATLMVVSIAAIFGIPQAFFRHYTESAEPEWKRRVTGAALGASLIVALGLAAVLLLLRIPLK